MWYHETADGLSISVSVIPGAARDSIVGVHGDELKVKTAVAPERGKANERVVELLAKLFQVKRRDVMLMAGHRSHRKRFMVTGSPKRLLPVARAIERSSR